MITCDSDHNEGLNTDSQINIRSADITDEAKTVAPGVAVGAEVTLQIIFSAHPHRYCTNQKLDCQLIPNILIDVGGTVTK